MNDSRQRALVVALMSLLVLWWVVLIWAGTTGGTEAMPFHWSAGA